MNGRRQPRFRLPGLLLAAPGPAPNAVPVGFAVQRYRQSGF